MEETGESAPESGPLAAVPGDPASSSRSPNGLAPQDLEDCSRPLDAAAPKKLCGYLSKFGGKGPIRGWKSRWFFYDERQGHLYYSRTAQDANPLDSIDLSGAVFNCKAGAEEGTFEIKTPSRVITLKVNGKFSPFQSQRGEFAGNGERARRPQSFDPHPHKYIPHTCPRLRSCNVAGRKDPLAISGN